MIWLTDEFNIYYREAGAGQLSISIEGPSKAKMDVVDRGNGYVTVGYTVTKEGLSVGPHGVTSLCDVPV